MEQSQIVRFLWGVVDLIGGTFSRGKYQEVILPLTVLRRLDCLLAPSKQSLLEAQARYEDKLDNLDGLLRKKSGFAFYNTSRYDFETLVQDAPYVRDNLLTYIRGFSANVREVLDKFDFYNTIDSLDESGLLFQVMERFAHVDLHSDAVSNDTMGGIFEELLRRFGETFDESAGEHFTPRDVVHLMVELMLSGDGERLRRPGVVTTVSDPCCGTGGMLNITKDHILGSEDRQGVNPEAHVHLFGQEVNPETYAVCKASLFMKDPIGWDVDRILYGSVLEADGHSGWHFDYQLSNPPYGKNWKRDKYAVESEARMGAKGRFPAGTPRISDGQLLFLQHMLTSMKPPEEGGSRVSMMTNASPLFTGDAGRGGSEIRRWVLENDWLEALVALPEQLFYNTGIATYIWILSNRKPPERQGRVLLIDATDLWQPMPRSLGSKRREIADDQAAEIVALLDNYREGERSKILLTNNFGYRKIRVERPLRLNFQASAERIARLQGERGFQSLPKRRKRRAAGQAVRGSVSQKAILEMLERLGDDLFRDRQGFRIALRAASRAAGVELTDGLRKAIESSLSERDEEAEPCRDATGKVEPDPDLRDYEYVPLDREVAEYFATEIEVYAQDAWVDASYTDQQDGGVGRIVYDIDFRIFGLRRLQIRAQEANLVPYSSREVVEEVRRLARASDGVSSPLATIYVPRTARGTVRLSREEVKSPEGYYEFRIRPEGPTTPRYLAAFLNSPEGQVFRKALSRGATVDQVSLRDWKNAMFYLPPIREQQESEELLGDIRSIEAGLATMRRQLWSAPRRASQLRTHLERLNPTRSTKEWVDALPFPLASVLWTAQAAPTESPERLSHLQHYFEATAEFLALVLLSGFANDPEVFAKEKKRIHEDLERSKLSLETASFGTWVAIAGRLSKQLRRSLNSGVQLQTQALTAFGVQALEVLEGLSSSAVIGILQRANTYRNRIGHGGPLNDRELRDGCSFLENLVEDYRANVAGLWEAWALILPDRSRFDGEVHEYACELAIGSRVPFEVVTLRLRDHAVSGRLHLYDRASERALPLLPLVKVVSSPEMGHKTCYFYSRCMGESIRFVSYQIASQMDMVEPDLAAAEALKSIISVD